MSRPGPDPLAEGLARLGARPVPAVDVADRVMARVARLPRPVRPAPRLGLGIAASVAALAASAAALVPAVAPIRAVATDAMPAVVAVLRGLGVAVAASGEAFVRAAGGLGSVQSLAATAAASTLVAGGSILVLLLAREIRRAPALARSPR